MLGLSCGGRVLTIGWAVQPDRHCDGKYRAYEQRVARGKIICWYSGNGKLLVLICRRVSFIIALLTHEPRGWVQWLLTVESHQFLDCAERVGSDALVFAEVVVVDVVYSQTQRQTVSRLVIDLNAVFRRRRAGQPSAVLLPVVDRLRKRRHDALENRLAPAPLPDTPVWQIYLRCNWKSTTDFRPAHTPYCAK